MHNTALYHSTQAACGGLFPGLDQEQQCPVRSRKKKWKDASHIRKHAAGSCRNSRYTVSASLQLPTSGMMRWASSDRSSRKARSRRDTPSSQDLPLPKATDRGEGMPEATQPDTRSHLSRSRARTASASCPGTQCAARQMCWRVTCASLQRTSLRTANDTEDGR